MKHLKIFEAFTTDNKVEKANLIWYMFHVKKTIDELGLYLKDGNYYDLDGSLKIIIYNTDKSRVRIDEDVFRYLKAGMRDNAYLRSTAIKKFFKVVDLFIFVKGMDTGDRISWKVLEDCNIFVNPLNVVHQDEASKLFHFRNFVSK